MLSQIRKRYNPECDVSGNRDGDLVWVTWAEYDLYEALMELTKRVEGLESENARRKKLRWQKIKGVAKNVMNDWLENGIECYRCKARRPVSLDECVPCPECGEENPIPF